MLPSHVLGSYLNKVVLRPPVPGETIKSYFANWFGPGCTYCQARIDSERPLSRRHAENQRRNLERHLFPSLGSVPVLELGRNQVIAWRASLEMGPRGRNAAVQTVGYLYGELLRNGMVHINPAAKLDKLPELRKSVDLLSQVEFERLFDLDTQDGYWCTRSIHFAACLVMAQTGMRISEVQALRGISLVHIDDSDWLQVSAAWDRAELRESTKSGRERRVPITPELATILRQLVRGSADFLFSTDGTEPLTHDQLRDALRGALVFIGIPRSEQIRRGIKPHAFRHRLNTILLRSLPEADVRAIIGHVGADMSRRYDRPSLEILGPSAAKVRGLFGGNNV
jgi:integrase